MLFHAIVRYKKDNGDIITQRIEYAREVSRSMLDGLYIEDRHGRATVFHKRTVVGVQLVPVNE